MNFSSAFKYPFQNLAKVISIVLALSIAFAVFIGLILNSHDWSPLFEQIYDLDPSEHIIGEPEAMGATPVIGFLGLIVVVN